VVAVGEAAAGKIRPGDLAFYEQNILLGEVLEVFGQTVKVKLFSAPGTKFTVSLGKNNLTAQIEGRGGGNFSIALPRGVTVETGELALITSGLQNLIVAVIGAVEADPESSFQQVFLRLPLNLNELKYVVIRPSA
jgi:cell shape-determining protein MreC